MLQRHLLQPEALKAVFVSGEPWLVWCSDSSTEGEVPTSASSCCSLLLLLLPPAHSCCPCPCCCSCCSCRSCSSSFSCSSCSSSNSPSSPRPLALLSPPPLRRAMAHNTGMLARGGRRSLTSAVPAGHCGDSFGCDQRCKQQRRNQRHQSLAYEQQQRRQRRCLIPL